MVKCIVQFNQKKTVQYFLGKEGAVRIEKPLVITASYLDHNKSLGKDQLMIKVK